MFLSIPTIADSAACATATDCLVREAHGMGIAIAMKDTAQPTCVVAVLPSGRSVLTSEDMLAYLQYEAKRRGVSIEELYDEETEHQRLARGNAFSAEELAKLVASSKPNQRLLEGEEECPF